MDTTRKLLVGITVVGLALDTAMHLRSAHGYDAIGTTITQGMLFRVEAVVAAIVAVALLWRPSRITAAAALVVAGGGVIAILGTYLVHVGAIGPVPDMYEHTMYAEKAIALVAQSVAAVTSLVLVVIGFPAQDRTPATVG
jgi:hypothetical protein